MGILSENELREIASVCPRLYAAVGWGAGKPPDWQAFRDCCHPQAMLVPMGSGQASPIPLETFIAGMEQQRSDGLVADLEEIEIGSSVEGYGNLANVTSGFVATINGEVRRGVTYAQIVRQDGRWQILSAAWENERDDHPIPPSLLGAV